MEPYNDTGQIPMTPEERVALPRAIGLAAMFDEAFLGEIADIIATETRAMYR